MSTISPDVPDWKREECRRFWDPGRQLLKSIRSYQSCQAKNSLSARILSKWYVICHRFWSAITGADIPLNCNLGGGLLIPHPNGIVIHPSAEIGPNCLIFQQVTIVGKVKIGGHVDIGAGAKLIKPVSVGNHARIGANAVVIQNVGANKTIATPPAGYL